MTNPANPYLTECPHCRRLTVYRNACLPCNRWVFWSYV